MGIEDGEGDSDDNEEKNDEQQGTQSEETLESEHNSEKINQDEEVEENESQVLHDASESVEDVDDEDDVSEFPDTIVKIELDRQDSVKISVKAEDEDLKPVDVKTNNSGQKKQMEET